MGGRCGAFQFALAIRDSFILADFVVLLRMVSEIVDAASSLAAFSSGVRLGLSNLGFCQKC